MKLDLDHVLLWVREVHGQVVEVLGELSSWSLDGHESGLDLDRDCG